jgi:hypothetical protein
MGMMSKKHIFAISAAILIVGYVLMMGQMFYGYIKPFQMILYRHYRI